MRVLIYFNGFTKIIGGSEYLPLTLIYELQKRGHEVALITGYPSDIAFAQEQYGVSVDLSRLRLFSLEPASRAARLMNRFFRCYKEWKLQQIAKKFDLCISSANIVDFGRPGIHFIYMLGFTPAFRDWLGWQTPELGINTPLRRLWRAASAWFADKFIVHVRTPGEILADDRETVYPNSKWAKQQIEEFFHCTTAFAFYPPTLYQPREGVAERSNEVVYIGRIDAMKRIEFIVDVVDRVRAATGVDLQLKIAGMLKDDNYCRGLQEKCGGLKWIEFLGPVFGGQKQSLLAHSKFAVHVLRDEAFGISVVEYLKSGIVPIVPNEGGAAEVVGDERLMYADQDDAVRKLSNLVSDSACYDSLAKACRARADYFSAEAYWERQGLLVGKLLNGVNTAIKEECNV